MVNTLVKSLIESYRTASAVAIVEEVSFRRENASCEDTFLLVLTALVLRGKYNEADDLLEHGQARGIKFTNKTFNLLVQMGWKELEEPSNTEARAALMTQVYDAKQEYEVQQLGNGILIFLAWFILAPRS